MMKHRYLAFFVLTLFVIGSIFVGCTGNGTTVTTTGTTTTPAGTTATTTKSDPTTSSNQQDDLSVPFAETFEFTMLEAIHQADEENDVEALLMEATNTKINYIKVPRTNFNEKLSVTLASGDLPDVVSFLWQSVEPQAWIDQGAIIPLDDMLEKYGTNITRHWTDDLMPHLRRSDGKIYSVKAMNSFPYNASLMIRHDWIEKLGLETPETIEEWIDVLIAFKTQDPNENNMADEIPWMSALGSWFAAYGIYGAGNYVLMDDDTLLPRYEHPYYKEAVMLLRDMFSQGLIDPEFSARDLDSMFEMLSTHKAGTGSFSGTEATRMTTLMRETDPNAVFGFVAPIKGPGGQNIQGRSPFGTSTAITIMAEEPEKCLLFLDFMFSDQGIEYTNFGKEGVHHIKVNGKPVLQPPYVEGFEQARKAGIAKGTWPLFWTGDNFMQILFRGKSEAELDELNMISYNAYTKNAEYAFYLLPGAIFQTETNLKLTADIWQPLSDMEINVIMGRAEWSSLESLINELKEYGMDKITEEVNVNYKAAIG